MPYRKKKKLDTRGYLILNAHGAMDHRIDPSLMIDQLFLVPASARRLVKQRPWHVLFCLWDGAYIISAFQRVAHVVSLADCPSC